MNVDKMPHFQSLERERGNIEILGFREREKSYKTLKAIHFCVIQSFAAILRWYYTSNYVISFCEEFSLKRGHFFCKEFVVLPCQTLFVFQAP